MTKVQLTLNGKALILGGPGRKAQQVIDFIHAIPSGQFFDIRGIAASLNTTDRAVDHCLRRNRDEVEGHVLLVPHETRNGSRAIYGSKAGIKAARKQLEKAELL